MRRLARGSGYVVTDGDFPLNIVVTAKKLRGCHVAASEMLVSREGRFLEKVAGREAESADGRTKTITYGRPAGSAPDRGVVVLAGNFDNGAPADGVYGVQITTACGGKAQAELAKPAANPAVLTLVFIRR